MSRVMVMGSDVSTGDDSEGPVTKPDPPRTEREIIKDYRELAREEELRRREI